MKARFLSIALPVATLLLIGLLAIAQVTRNAPAFSTNLRSPSVLGDWRIAESNALFDKSEYFFQLGFGYLQADTAALILGQEALPEPEVFDEQMAHASRHLDASIASAPGRVDAWTSMSWAALMRDDVETAETALRTSWALAPFNVSEASERLALVAALDEFHRDGWRDDNSAIEAIARDTEVLALYDRRYLTRLYNEREELGN